MLALAVQDWGMLGLLAVVIVAGYGVLGARDKLHSNDGNGNGKDD